MKSKQRKKLAAYFAATTMAVSTFFSVPVISVNAEEEIAIDEAHFPDENFREYVKTRIDTDGNGMLSNDEINNVSRIYIGWSEVSSLQGIELFGQLESLDCTGNSLSGIDVSKNKKLERLNCSANNLNSLNVSANENLKELDCYDNKLSSLDVSKSINLEELHCYNNNLSNLDVSKSINLEKLHCYNNNLSSLDVSKNENLKELDCSANNLSSLDVSKNENLKELDCSANNLSSLDVSKNVNLKKLYCNDNKLSSLDVSNNVNLYELLCSENNLSNIDVRNNANLNWLFCPENNLCSIDVSKNTNLESLFCSGNNLSSIDVSKNTNLKRLTCDENNLSSIDVSKNINLENLSCDGNNLSSIDVSKNTNLWELSCSNNNLGSLYINNNLHRLYCDESILNALSDTISQYTKLDIYISIVLDSNNQHDLSGINWLNIDSSDIEFLLLPEMYANYREDFKSYLSGSIINIVDQGQISGFVSISTDTNIYLRIDYDMSSSEEPTPELPTGEFAQNDGYKFVRDEAGDVRCYNIETGVMLINEFRCDGTYTYYFQADGTAMKDRLTYHPDGVHVIYFDQYGHEVFSDFANVKKSIAGDAVDDMCFFNVYGYMYVDTLTYDKTGTKLYYVNPYGVLERTGWFAFSGKEFDAGLGFSGRSGGYGYANADCSLMINTYTYDWDGNYVYIQGDGHMFR